MKKKFKEGNQIHNPISSSGYGTIINYGSCSDFLTSCGSGSGSSSTSQKVTVPMVPVPVPQRCYFYSLFSRESLGLFLSKIFNTIPHGLWTEHDTHVRANSSSSSFIYSTHTIRFYMRA
jgi:hypothetical protein